MRVPRKEGVVAPFQKGHDALRFGVVQGTAIGRAGYRGEVDQIVIARAELRLRDCPADEKMAVKTSNKHDIGPF